MKTLFENKHVELYSFVAGDDKKRYAIRFKTDQYSDSAYLGFEQKRAPKVAKWFRKMAKKLEKL